MDPIRYRESLIERIEGYYGVDDGFSALATPMLEALICTFIEAQVLKEALNDERAALENFKKR